MDKLVLNFYRFLMLLACLAMINAFGTVLLGIAAREFGWDIAGLDAYAGYTIAAALFLALPGTLRNGDHIRVTLVIERLPARLRAALEWWCITAALVLSLYIAWYAVRLVWLSYTTHDISPAADASPLWIPQISMALGCVGFALSFVQALVNRMQGHNFIAAPAEAARVE